MAEIFFVLGIVAISMGLGMVVGSALMLRELENPGRADQAQELATWKRPWLMTPSTATWSDLREFPPFARGRLGVARVGMAGHGQRVGTDALFP
jgi:hypothetical protein